jgi:DNA-binding transcriptional regulator YdaS (Cro superfamily)
VSPLATRCAGNIVCWSLSKLVAEIGVPPATISRTKKPDQCTVGSHVLQIENPTFVTRSSVAPGFLINSKGLKSKIGMIVACELGAG